VGDSLHHGVSAGGRVRLDVPGFGPAKVLYSTLVALSRQKSIFGPIHLQSRHEWPKSEHFEELLTLLDFRLQNRILVIVISTVSMRQNHKNKIMGGGTEGNGV
jgi:hypothetical protein